MYHKRELKCEQSGKEKERAQLLEHKVKFKNKIKPYVYGAHRAAADHGCREGEKSG